MFAPQGFQPVVSIYDNYTASKFDSAFETAVGLTGRGEVFEGEPLGVRRFFSLAPMDMLESDFFQNIADHIHLCSPKGDVLKVDWSVVTSATNFAPSLTTDLLKFAEDNPDLAPHPYNFQATNRLIIWPWEEFEKDFEEFRQGVEENFEATPWHFAKQMTMEKWHQRVPLFYERQCLTICLEAFDYFRQGKYIDFEELDNLARVLRPFEGWALCVPDDFASSLAPFTPEAIEAVAQSIKSERDAYREAREILERIRDKTIRQGQLRKMISTSVGERQWGRIVGLLRQDYEYISFPGAPRKE